MTYIGLYAVTVESSSRLASVWFKFSNTFATNTVAVISCHRRPDRFWRQTSCSICSAFAVGYRLIGRLHIRFGFGLPTAVQSDRSHLPQRPMTLQRTSIISQTTQEDLLRLQ
jgi:hypothetical protein